MDARAKKEVRDIMGGIMADSLSRPIKRHAKHCKCNPCLVAAKRRELRAANIKAKQEATK